MKKNAAENVFVNVLSEVPTIRKNGITHSDDFFEIMLDDANLSNEERSEVLSSVGKKAKEEIKRLEEIQRELIHEVDTFENNDGLLDQSITQKQRESFTYHVMMRTLIFFGIITMIILLVAAFGILRDGSQMRLAFAADFILSLIVARVSLDKSEIYSAEETLFKENLTEKSQQLEDIKADILSLKRLETIIDTDSD